MNIILEKGIGFYEGLDLIYKNVNVGYKNYLMNIF